MLPGERRHVLDRRREVGGPVQLDPLQAPPVGGLHPGDALAVRVGVVAVDEEAVRDEAARGEAGAEAQDGEELVAVVVLDDLADGLDGLLVLVGDAAAAAHEVEGARVVGGAVGLGEVDGDGAGQLGAAADVVQEGVALHNVGVGHVHVARVLVALLLL